MGCSAAATAGYAWLAGPLLAQLGEMGFDQLSPNVAPQNGRLANLSLPQIAIALVLLSLVRSLAETSRAFIGSKLQLTVVREIRGKVLAHVLALPAASLARWPSGELASRVQVEVHGVRSLLNLGLTQGIQGVAVATALAIVALQVDTTLAIPGLLLLPLAVAGVSWVVRPARRLYRRLLGAESTLVAESAEAIEGAGVLRAYDAAEMRLQQIDDSAGRAERLAVRAETWSTLSGPMVELAGALGIAGMLTVAWATRAEVDVASTGSVLVALLLMYRPLQSIARSAFGWWSGLASVQRLDEILELPTDRSPPAGVRSSFRSIRLCTLGFDYGDGPIWREAEHELRAGEFVAVTGESGSGKSTLLRVLAGALPPSTGRLELDGVVADGASLRATSAWMAQRPAVFRDSILGNITLGDPNPDRARALAAARRAHVDDFVEERPSGYEGMLREGGADLSAGQLQRLMLARALYRQAPILLLDEPAAALDARHEALVLQVCREAADAGQLVVVATHRQDFLRNADRVLEVRNLTVNEWPKRTERLHLH